MPDIVTRAAAMSSIVMERRFEMERARRLPDQIATALASNGIFKMLVPTEYGGAEVPPPTFVSVLETLAGHDASVAWCAMIGATSGVLAAYLPAEDAATIFSPADSIVTGVFAPTGRATIEGDQLRVSGRWKWNSGGDVSTWLGGGILIDTEEKAGPRMALFPATAATRLDTWHTSGLKGTGSGDIEVHDILVPRRRSVSLVGDRAKIERPLYAFPLFGLLAVGIAAVAAGNAQGALADFKATARARHTAIGRVMAERGSTAAAFASATADIESARAYLADGVAEAWDRAARAPDLPPETRAKLRLAATHMTRTAARVVRELQDLAGGPAVFVSDPLHRRAADAQTMTAHMMIALPTYELAGHVLIGNAADTRQL